MFLSDVDLDLKVEEVATCNVIEEGISSMSSALSNLRKNGAVDGKLHKDAAAKLAGFKRKAVHMSQLLDTAMLRTPGLVEDMVPPFPLPLVGPFGETDLETVKAMDIAIQTANMALAATLDPFITKALEPVVPKLWATAPAAEAASTLAKHLTPCVSAALHAAQSDEALRAAFASDKHQLAANCQHYLPGAINVAAFATEVGIAVAPLRRCVFAITCSNTEHMKADTRSKALKFLGNPSSDDGPIKSTEHLAWHVHRAVPTGIEGITPEIQSEIKEGISAAIWRFRDREVDQDPNHRSVRAAHQRCLAEVQTLMRARLEHVGSLVDLTKVVAQAHDTLRKYLLHSNFHYKAAWTDSVTQVNVVATGIFRATVTMRCQGGCDPVRVTIVPDDADSSLDPWTDPEAVRSYSGDLYLRLTAISCRALAFFRARALMFNKGHPGVDALKDLLYWLSLYRERPEQVSGSGRRTGACLFTRPSSRTQYLLAVDPDSRSLLPPVFRQFRLSTADLECAACDSSFDVPSHHMSDALLPDDM